MSCHSEHTTNEATTDGSYTVTTMDEFVDRLLTEERVCEVQLPRLTIRKVLEENEGLIQRRSRLAKAMGIEGSDDEGSDYGDRERYLSRSPSASGSEAGRNDRYVSRSPSRSRNGSPQLSRSRSGSPEREPFISRSPSPSGYVSRSPTRSPEPEVAAQDGDAMRID